MKPGRGGCLLIVAHCWAFGAMLAGWAWLMDLGIGPGVLVAVAFQGIAYVSVVGWVVADQLQREDE